MGALCLRSSSECAYDSYQPLFSVGIIFRFWNCLADQRLIVLSCVQGMMRGEELSQAYASGDVFVMPSESETLGFVVLEAMASQVPVVAVAAGGLTDIITAPGSNGAGALTLLQVSDQCKGNPVITLPLVRSYRILAKYQSAPNHCKGNTFEAYRKANRQRKRQKVGTRQESFSSLFASFQ
jgi:glycosyltransferase involved in cell wall biosynthesis